MWSSARAFQSRFAPKRSTVSCQFVPERPPVTRLWQGSRPPESGKKGNAEEEWWGRVSRASTADGHVGFSAAGGREVPGRIYPLREVSDGFASDWTHVRSRLRSPNATRGGVFPVPTDQSGLSVPWKDLGRSIPAPSDVARPACRRHRRTNQRRVSWGKIRSTGQTKGEGPHTCSNYSPTVQGVCLSLRSVQPPSRKALRVRPRSTRDPPSDRTDRMDVGRLNWGSHVLQTFYTWSKISQKWKRGGLSHRSSRVLHRRVYQPAGFEARCNGRSARRDA